MIRMGLACLAFATAACGGDGDEPRPDVLLVSIDTLRADGLGTFGNPLPTSPHLDALAREGFAFEEAYSSAAATAPSHATLFTGFGPWVHRVENMRTAGQPTPGLDASFVTLAERFQGAGYETAAFTDGGPLGKDWNLHQGFDVHVGRLEGVEAKVDQALAFLAQRDTRRPLFLFLHTYQVHVPYVAPLEWAHAFTPPDYDGPVLAAEAAMRAALADGTLKPDGKILLRDKERFEERDVDYLRRLYYGEIAFTDHQLERLWSALRASGRIDATLIAVTSDHGEEFGEHGNFGHRQFYREGLHVPLILRLPVGRSFPKPPAGGARITARVRVLDLYRTLLDAAALPCPEEVQGRSLLACLRAGRFDDEPAVAIDAPEDWRGDEVSWRQGLREGDFALLREVGSGKAPELFDLASDPHERSPLSAQDGEGPRLSAALDAAIAEEERLRAFLLRGGESEVQPMDPETLRELENLGYIEVGDAPPDESERR